MAIKKIPYKHRKATKVALVASAALGPLGALAGPGDVLAIAGVWSACLISVAAKEGCDLDKDTALGICKSVAWGIAGYYAGCKVANYLFLLIPGAGFLMAMGASSVANIIFTYRFVLTLCKVFENSGSGEQLKIDKIADEIIAVFKGNGIINDIRDIISIYSSDY